MHRAIVIGAALIVAIGWVVPEPGLGAVQAQPNKAPTISATINQRASSPEMVHRELRGLKPGMVVKDRRGATVGLITKVEQSKDGKPAVQLDVNGTTIIVLASRFRLSRRGDEAVISLTRSQIRTSAILNTR